MISAYMAKNRLKVAFEAEVCHMVVEATNMEIHDVRPGVKFKPKQPDKPQHLGIEIQRLDCIYGDEPLGFQKDPITPVVNMLAHDPLEEIDLGNWGS